MLNPFSKRSKSKQNKPDNLPHDNVPFDAYKGTKPYIFISYAHADKRQAYEQIKNLNANGYRIWYDEGIEPGKNFVENIAQAIENCAYFLVFISPNSIASEYVNKEIHFALENKCPFLAVHLTQTNLPSGLKFSIGALQAILKHEIDEDRYWKKLMEILPEKLMNKKTDRKRPEERSTAIDAEQVIQDKPGAKGGDKNSLYNIGPDNITTNQKQDDKEIIENLFSQAAHEKNVDQEALIKKLFKFNLNGFENELIKLMQHAGTNVRLRLMEELAGNPGKLSFSFELLTEQFEHEKHDITKTRIARLLFQTHPELSKTYFLQVLEYKEPSSVKAIFGGINFIKNTPGFAKEAALELLPVFSENIEVKKAINNYLARLR